MITYENKKNTKRFCIYLDKGDGEKGKKLGDIYAKDIEEAQRETDRFFDRSIFEIGLIIEQCAHNPKRKD